MQFAEFSSHENQATFEAEFVKKQGSNEVLCMGDFSHLHWKVSPLSTTNLDGSTLGEPN